MRKTRGNAVLSAIDPHGDDDDNEADRDLKKFY
jgi:hypothetical protein